MFFRVFFHQKLRNILPAKITSYMVIVHDREIKELNFHIQYYCIAGYFGCNNIISQLKKDSWLFWQE
jgi:hypothetical protein